MAKNTKNKISKFTVGITLMFTALFMSLTSIIIMLVVMLNR